MLAPEHGPIGHCVLDKNHRVLVINSAFLDILGRDRSGVVGELEVAFTYHADCHVSEELIDRLILDNEPFSITKRYISGNGGVVWVTNHVFLREIPNSTAGISITSSKCGPVISDTVAENWQIANRISLGFAAGKTALGADMFCAASGEALLALYMAESDGRSLTLEDVSMQVQIAIPAMARWIRVLAERDLVEVDRQSMLPASTVLRISQGCFDTLDKLLRETSS